MPIYAYGCTKCDHPFEKNVKIAVRNEQVCERCNAPAKILLVESSTNNNIVTGLNHRKKVPGWFKDKLQVLKKDSGKQCTIDI